jgi:formylglycine-generating enzyme required for sulfatase activity
MLVVSSSSQAFVYFSLEDVPEGAVVRFARLRLYFASVTSAGQGLSIHRITSPWQESSAGALPAFTQAPIASIPPDRIGARRFVSVDVSSLVQDWIDNPASNEGLAVAAVSAVPPAKTAGLRIPSKEGPAAGLPAQLEVELVSSGTVQVSGGTVQLARGPKGDIGSQGPVGPVGPIGPQGQVGPQGVQGPKGDTGAQGPKGEMGVQGLQGPQGEAGPAGADSSGGLNVRWNGHEMVGIPFTSVAFSKTETTVAQWREFVIGTGWSKSTAWMTPGFYQSDLHPVVSVSWEDAREYCDWLSKKTGKTWRLPTILEWRLAAGASLFPWGDNWPPTPQQGNYGAYGQDGYLYTSPVCAYEPNVYGLFDMGGNVAEWMGDTSYDGDVSKRALCGATYLMTIDGTLGGQVVFTGEDVKIPLRTIFRLAAQPSVRGISYGFRVVLER